YDGFLLTHHHSNIHLRYHGTIDWRTPTSDTQATITTFERTNWWTAAELQGKAAGAYFTLIAGADRFSTNAPAGGTDRVRDGVNQMFDLGAGRRSGSRWLLESNSGVWPNILTFEVTGGITNTGGNRVRHAILGDKLPVRVRYQANRPYDTLSISVSLDRDF